MSEKCIRSIPAAAMAGYQDLSDFERDVVIGAREMRHSISDVAMKFGISRTTISRVYREYRVSVRIGTIPSGQCDTPRVESCYQVAPGTHSSDFRHFHWPPKSPEMNIIEDIRDDFLHAVENRFPPPRTPMDLWTVLKDEWCKLPPRYLQTLVESMPHRVAQLLCVRVDPTRY
ncbi:hypothetical protein AVEN_82111-1 [Araneus ventricosus]|uniref:Tc3 transposase DNA binding domain-containing protein n=1 Tax=Araneus ventricosus TaxID=182803 RepID=A0A4Y2I3M6_ARAVE|nr:hypothetical protein AVEN_82111-1 [Araneus ventricosus]